MKPTFSIITVCYNAQDEIGFTLESVKSQTFSDYEYIVVDGASVDSTLEIVHRATADMPRTTVKSEKDKGIYYAMNKGLDLSIGEYVIFLNAGDTFSDNDVLYRIADAAKRTHADIIYGQTQIVNKERKVIGMRHLTAPEHLEFDDFKRGMLVCHQAFIPRRKIARHYNTEYLFSADYEWCLRCLRQSKRNFYIGGTIINYLDGGTTNKNHKASLKERFKIMSQYYGLFPTILRHISFIPRYLARR